MRGSYEDDGLESRFLTENMNTRHMRPEIPIHTPTTMRTEALALRNKLLHFRLCSLFDAKIDPSLAFPRLEPRLNQIALPLLSIVDNQELRTQIGEWLGRQSESGTAVRTKELLLKIMAVLRDAFVDELVTAIPIRTIAERVNAQRSDERFTTKQIARAFADSLVSSFTKATVFMPSREPSSGRSPMQHGG